jgi:tetratricopeptide (TPR) repeat protein
MDAQVLQELVLIRWMVTAMAVAAVVFAVIYTAFFVVNYRLQMREELRKAGGFFDRGNALLSQGKLDELLALCDEHVLEFPADGPAYWLMGNAHYRRKNFRQALICYRKADELQPGWSLATAIAEIEERLAQEGRSRELKVVPAVAKLESQDKPSESH